MSSFVSALNGHGAWIERVLSWDVVNKVRVVLGSDDASDWGDGGGRGGRCCDNPDIVVETKTTWLGEKITISYCRNCKRGNATT